ncbi:hypothetical protein BS47DRAFT_1348663 [Hydnum rufescens UP504]|uniref:Uncharacterized protein n=1 Tax=Hydnum rufescens UP504 TaxID=1448309 RepID=A0A9P6AQK4_9AGAM|nr:hypothetical protein BS47DRAFT_1348663 [Hydnum rufescens UP504]
MCYLPATLDLLSLSVPSSRVLSRYLHPLERLRHFATSMPPHNGLAPIQLGTENMSGPSLQRSKSESFLLQSSLPPQDARTNGNRLDATSNSPPSLATSYRHPQSIAKGHQIATLPGGRYHHSRTPAVTAISTGSLAPPNPPQSEMAKIKTIKASSPSPLGSTHHFPHRRSPGFDSSSFQALGELDHGSAQVTGPAVPPSNHRVNTPLCPALVGGACDHSEPLPGAPVQNNEVETSETIRPASVFRYDHDRPSRGFLAHVQSSPRRGLPPPRPPPAYPAPRRRVSFDIGRGSRDRKIRTPPAVEPSMRTHPFSVPSNSDEEDMTRNLDQYARDSKYCTIHAEWYELLYAQATLGGSVDSAKDNEDDKADEANIDDVNTRSAGTPATLKGSKGVPEPSQRSAEGCADADGVGNLFLGPGQSIALSKEDNILVLGLALQFSSEIDGAFLESAALPDEENVLPREDNDASRPPTNRS